MIYKYFFFALLAVVILFVVIQGIHFRAVYRIKKARINVFAIQNVQTRKCIRPHNAHSEDNNKVILYELHNWGCLTWRMIHLGDNTYLLQNTYTEKTFQPQPQDGKVQGSTMYQKPLGGTKLQYWEFVKQENGQYLIKLKGSDLYLTAENNEQNANIILQPLLPNSEAQFWQLRSQTPIL